MTAELVRWLVTGLVTALMIVNWFWFKRWISQQDKERQEWIRAGGLVTREMYFNWCKDQQGKCSALGAYRQLTDWRNAIADKGGILMTNEHSVICKEITKEVAERFCERLDEMLTYHREWVGQELKLLRLEIEKSQKS